MKYVYNLINMDKYFSKFTIGSICIVAPILMLIVTNSVDISNAHAQTIGTKRTIEIQKTISSGENVTDVGNELTTSSRSIDDNIGGIAIDKFTNIYLADSGNNRIQKFDGAGKFITKWGSTGSGDSQFSGTLDIATDPNANVYIFDGDNQSIQKFDREGTFLGRQISR